MSTFKIGSFSFISFSAAPNQPNKQLAIEARAGIAGETVWNTGSRGSPLQLMAIRDTSSVGDALDLFKQYQELIGGEPQQLVWASADYGQTKFIVLDVRAAENGVHAIVGGRGGISGVSNFSYGMQRTFWELLPVDTTL